MTRRVWFVAIALVVAVFIGSVIVYPSLPERIPSHWNIHGQVDAYGPRSTIIIMPFIMVMMLGLFAALPVISPQSFKLDTFSDTYGSITLILLGMLAFIQVTLLISVSRPQTDLTRIMIPGICFFFALLGNVMGKVRRNFFVGVRVPWTLASERVWNETHRLAAWLFFGSGILGALVGLLGYPLVGLILLAPAAVVPILFSLIRYKQLERRGEL